MLCLELVYGRSSLNSLAPRKESFENGAGVGFAGPRNVERGNLRGTAISRDRGRVAKTALLGASPEIFRPRKATLFRAGNCAQATIAISLLGRPKQKRTADKEYLAINTVAARSGNVRRVKTFALYVNHTRVFVKLYFIGASLLPETD